MMSDGEQRLLLATALFDNVADTPDELSFCRGDLMNVIETDCGGLEGWWMCVTTIGQTGLAPANRLRIVNCTATQDERFARKSLSSEPSVDYDIPLTHRNISQQRQAGDNHRQKPADNFLPVGRQPSSDYDVPASLDIDTGHVSWLEKSPQSKYREIPPPPRSDHVTGDAVKSRRCSVDTLADGDVYDIPRESSRQRPSDNRQTVGLAVAEKSGVSIDQFMTSQREILHSVAQISNNAVRWRSCGKSVQKVASIIKTVCQLLLKKLVVVVSFCDEVMAGFSLPLHLSSHLGQRLELLRLSAEGLEAVISQSSSPTDSDFDYVSEVEKIAVNIQTNLSQLVILVEDNLSNLVGPTSEQTSKQTPADVYANDDVDSTKADSRTTSEGMGSKLAKWFGFTKHINRSPAAADRASDPGPSDYDFPRAAAAACDDDVDTTSQSVMRRSAGEVERDKRVAIVMDKNDNKSFDILERRQHSGSYLTLTKLVTGSLSRDNINDDSASTEAVDYDYPVPQSQHISHLSTQVSSPRQKVTTVRRELVADVTQQSDWSIADYVDKQLQVLDKTSQQLVNHVELNPATVMQQCKAVVIATYRLILVGDSCHCTLPGNELAEQVKSVVSTAPDVTTRHCIRHLLDSVDTTKTAASTLVALLKV